MRRYTAVACLLLVAFASVATAHAQTDSGEVGNVQLLTIAEGGTCVVATVAVPGGNREAADLSDIYFEFTFRQKTPGEIVEFSAHLMDTMPVRIVSIQELPWIAGWEVTPADYLNELGGYARLFLPPEMMAGVQYQTNVSFAIYTASLSPVDLLTAVGQGRLVWSERARE
jgi:hypothetical protein